MSLSQLVAESTPWEPIPAHSHRNRHPSGPQDVFGFPARSSRDVTDPETLGDLKSARAKDSANGGPTTSKNYKGVTSSARNISEDINNAQNTSLWLTGLPGDIDYHRLLSSIRNIGRVYKVHIVQAGGEHLTAAATIQFFKLRATEALMQHIRDGTFVVEGHFPHAIRNRVRTSERGPEEDGLSRVIVMRGHSHIVNRDRILGNWAKRFYWDDDEVLEFRHGDETVLEIRFASL
ncbi:uncharacterized protein PG998_008532 [Apiospora kogelbergensis]|uniref:uncharacterized protein n=1 Tax=Apiospora kogelbergensis TaxID=1337665 RepID=UPI00312E0BE7